MRLDGKRTLVTGAASGIGLATAEVFARAGSEVILTDIAGDRAAEAAARLSAQGLTVTARQLDVASDASVDAVAADVGRVDVLVNVAGWGKIQPFVENDKAFWDKVIAINFYGVVKLTHALLPQMIERRSGRIVNVASDAGRVGSLGETVYAGAKAGVIGFTKSLAREGARHGINVNCVCPGPTDTPLLAAVSEKHREAFQKAIPMRRFGKPHEIADAALFFASSRADYVTGQILSVSGGLTLAG
ncbi:SDR family oxidoreductase [Ramlibacter sp. RBP-2]|uniref:SDR family oxidoreductase n=1 Tax=Ramlibacter lithotrophicus TaxID=2606681 RepID=A0A7X6DKN3_9BURK|nr:SDR family NAD(P)-dependent oxidoreductase [Ramlibacter lithotrophicus]NKE68895.1 SDR family oxidoreductase [Ramlibacter lithotrophicus]